MDEEHLKHLLGRYSVKADRKYRLGYLKHNGDLKDKTPLELLYEALDENIDQAFYLLEAIEKLE